MGRVTYLRDDHVFLIAKIAMEKVPLDDANAADLGSFHGRVRRDGVWETIDEFAELFLDDGYAIALELYQDYQDLNTRLLIEHEWK